MKRILLTAATLCFTSIALWGDANETFFDDTPPKLGNRHLSPLGPAAEDHLIILDASEPVADNQTPSKAPPQPVLNDTPVKKLFLYPVVWQREGEVACFGSSQEAGTLKRRFETFLANTFLKTGQILLFDTSDTKLRNNRALPGTLVAIPKIPRGMDMRFKARIEELTMQRETVHSELTGETKKKLKAAVTISYTVHQPATGRLLLAETYRTDYETPGLRRLDAKLRSRRLADILLFKAANGMVKTVMAKLFPPQVIAISKGSVLINRGTADLPIGTAVLIHPDNRQSPLRATVTFTDEQSALASFQEANATRNIRQGNRIEPVVSKLETKMHTLKQPETNVTKRPPEGGGVRLPFD